MCEATKHAKEVLERLSTKQQREVLAWLREKHPIHPIEASFGAPAEVILEAIARSSDLSQRGVLGLLAEAYFEREVLGQVKSWRAHPIEGHFPFDFELRQGDRRVTIQIKRQRREAGKPKIYKSTGLYAVETQRTRGGRKKAGEGSTRPYVFGDFDILAVSMQPSTGDWSTFRYTVQRWLLPRKGEPDCLETIQPVSPKANNDWSDHLETAIEWFCSGSVKQIAVK